MADMRLRFRVYVDGEIADESWVGVGSDVDGEQLALKHRALCDAASDHGQLWLIEVYDPGEPEHAAYYRFGTDPAGMVLPITLGGPPPPNAN
jgi:hypothetical protein